MTTPEMRRMNDLRRQRQEQKKRAELIKEKQIASQIQFIIGRLIKEEHKRLLEQDYVKQAKNHEEMKEKIMKIQESRIVLGNGRKQRTKK